jgi:hypothetical protein
MSEFGDLDELLADLDDAAETGAAALAADGANDAEARSAPGLPKDSLPGRQIVFCLHLL